MKTIGITGGVGAGKSAVLAYLQSNYNCYIMMADQIAHDVKKKGEQCYEQLIKLLGKQILAEDLEIDRVKMAQVIFRDQNVLKQVNEVIHPAVKERIREILAKEKEADRYDFVFVEAALLIEEHYDEELDEIWYLYTQEDVRRERLKESRGYTDAKIDEIVAFQLSDEQFRKHTDFVLDNSGTLEKTIEQIQRKMGEYL